MYSIFPPSPGLLLLTLCRAENKALHVAKLTEEGFGVPYLFISHQTTILHWQGGKRTGRYTPF